MEDEEQAVMKGTISYAMSQTRDQQSMDSNNSARDYECLRGQTPGMSGDPAQVRHNPLNKMHAGHSLALDSSKDKSLAHS